MSKRKKIRDLGHPEVDQEWADEHIRQECERIQRTWSEADRRARMGSRSIKYLETPVISEGTHFRNGRFAVRKP